MKQKERAEQVAELIEKFEEQDWMKVASADEDDVGCFEEEREELYFIACEKAFKTEKQCVSFSLVSLSIIVYRQIHYS